MVSDLSREYEDVVVILAFLSVFPLITKSMEPMEVQSPIVESDGKDMAHFEFVSYPKY